MTNQDVIRYPEQIIKNAVTQFSTPFFIYEESRIRENCQRINKSFKKYFDKFSPLFAVKANSNPHVLKIILDEGFGFDCSSPSEVWLAERFNAFGMHTGNYNTPKELKQIVKNNKLLLNLDDISMLEILKKVKIPGFLSFRVNPGISGATMKSLQFAGIDAKFGIQAEKAIEAYKLAKKLGVKKYGIHMMTGSNVLDESYFPQITKKLFKTAGDIHKKLGIEFEYFNIGGGFGVPYKPTEKTLDLAKIAKDLRIVFDTECKKWNMKEPTLMIEPGRLVTADAGFLVTKVNNIKKSYKKFIGVDAGMNDLPRPAIYDTYHHVSVLGKKETNKAETVNIVGRLCENNDQFAKERKLPNIVTDDICIIHNAGAHSYTMGHNYNGRTRSDEYLATTKGKLKHIRRAETFSDLFNTIIDFDL